MMNRILVFIAFVFFVNGNIFAFVGRDTVVVQLFTFDDIEKRRGIFELPDDNRTWEKILMVRTLKCDEQTTQDKYPCGEWDYSTHTFLYIPKEDTVEIFELENYVTPYGKRLDLGDDGWTYIYDVTDYAPLLKGKIDISSGNTQELLDMKFIFIEGIPPRKILKVENLYPVGDYKYEKLADDSVLKPIELILDKNASDYMFRATISGHGHAGPRNCCEWDSKTHTYYVDGEVFYRWNVWKNCGDNPIYPQGGTWQFDRAGWCPGTPVDIYDFHSRGKYKPGDTLKFDYGIEMYRENGEKEGIFRMSHQLFSCGPPNFDNDAAIVDIVAPSNRDEYSRVNPICKNPQIIIRNNGKHNLRNLTIEYGLKGGLKESYAWNGDLKFLGNKNVVLPNIIWDFIDDNPQFEVEISSPNGNKDEYSWNNTMVSEVVVPDILPPQIFLKIRVQKNGHGAENGYRVTNELGEVIYERDCLEDGEIIQDYMEFEEGCYEICVFDRKENGMIRQWWYGSSKPEKVGRNGAIGIFDNEHNLLKKLKFDFAESEIYRFRVVGYQHQ